MEAAARPARPPGADRLALVASAVVLALLGAWALTHPTGQSGDSLALVEGARQIVTCVEDGIRSDCDFYGGVPEGAVAPYPLLQYAPALVLTQLGTSDAGALRGLMVLNLLAFGAMLWLGATTAAAGGRRWAAPAFLATLVASPLLWYLSGSFGEPLAAALLLALVAGALRRWPPSALALLALLAAITKETAFPFTLALALLCLWRTPLDVARRRRAHTVALVGGTLAAVVLSSAFNWFRYGQLTNFTYGHEYFRVPGVGLKVELSTAVWVAPNGGVLWFWPLATALLLAAIVAALAGARRSAAGRAVAGSAAALLLLVLLQTGVLGSWWAPFGWIAWGPRLMLPLIPAAVLAALVLLGRPLEPVLRRLPAGGWLAVAAVVAAVAVPNALVLSSPTAVGGLFTPDARCPAVPNILPDPDYYYGCIEHYAYERRLVLVSAVEGDHIDWGWGLGAAVGLASLLLVARMADTARRGAGPQPPSVATA